MRQITDEADRIRQQRVARIGQVPAAYRGIQRGEQLIGRVNTGTGQPVENRRFTGVGVANQRHGWNFCALAFAAIGDRHTATDLLAWTRAHRRDDGAYWTGLVHQPDRVPATFPFEEHTSYTAAAVVLAAAAEPGARWKAGC